MNEEKKGPRGEGFCGCKTRVQGRMIKRIL